MKDDAGQATPEKAALCARLMYEANTSAQRLSKVMDTAISTIFKDNKLANLILVEFGIDKWPAKKIRQFFLSSINADRLMQMEEFLGVIQLRSEFEVYTPGIPIHSQSDVGGMKLLKVNNSGVAGSVNHFAPYTSQKLQALSIILISFIHKLTNTLFHRL